MSKHTPEPWGHAPQGMIVSMSEDALPGRVKVAELHQDDARRIVACVNACRGLPTDELEQKGLVAAVGTQLLAADDRAEAQEREIRRLASIAADAENRLADALNQSDELLAALEKIGSLDWKRSLQGLDRPTDFAERQAALLSFGEAQNIARKAITVAKGGVA